MVNKRVWNALLGCNLKNDRMISVRLQGKPFDVTVIQVYAPTSNTEEAEVELFYEDLQDFLELIPKKWKRAKAHRVLPRECTGHSKHPLPTQEKIPHTDVTRWSTQKSDWLCSMLPNMETLYTVSKNKTGSWLRSWTSYCQIQTKIEESRYRYTLRKHKSWNRDLEQKN